MPKYKVTQEQILEAQKASYEVLKQVTLGGLNPESTILALKRIRHIKGGDPIVLFSDASEYCGDWADFIIHEDGSISLLTLHKSLTDEQVIKSFKKAGYIIDSSFEGYQRVKYPCIGSGVNGAGKNLYLVKSSMHQEAVEGDNIFKSEDTGYTVTDRELGFDFEDLHNFVLGRESKLIDVGVSGVVAKGSHYKIGDRSYCVYVALKAKSVFLLPFNMTMSEDDWIGLYS